MEIPGLLRRVAPVPRSQKLLRIGRKAARLPGGGVEMVVRRHRLPPEDPKRGAILHLPDAVDRWFIPGAIERWAGRRREDRRVISLPRRGGGGEGRREEGEGRRVVARRGEGRREEGQGRRAVARSAGGEGRQEVACRMGGGEGHLPVCHPPVALPEGRRAERRLLERVERRLRRPLPRRSEGGQGRREDRRQDRQRRTAGEDRRLAREDTHRMMALPHRMGGREPPREDRRREDRRTEGAHLLLGREATLLRKGDRLLEARRRGTHRRGGTEDRRRGTELRRVTQARLAPEAGLGSIRPQARGLGGVGRLRPGPGMLQRPRGRRQGT